MKEETLRKYKSDRIQFIIILGIIFMSNPQYVSNVRIKF